MFTKSENMRNEYCAQIVKIGKLEPIENSDNLVKTMIGGAYQVVVGKNDVKEGDIMIYCKLETAINQEFLSVNNQFEIGFYHLNNNAELVKKLIDADKKDEAKKMVGYFNQHGRVRIVKLRGCASEGCLFSVNAIAKWVPNVSNFNFDSCFTPNSDGIIEPFCFDTIDNRLFVKAYVPNITVVNTVYSKSNKRDKLLQRYYKMIEGQFAFHYDTNQLQDNMWRFNPNTIISVSVKVHGTSVIIGKLLIKKPKKDNIRSIQLKHEAKMLKKKKCRFYWEKKVVKNQLNYIKGYLDSRFTQTYGNVTSSRKVIKNKYINKGKINHYYKPLDGQKDIWMYYGDLLYPYLMEGMTVYGEIVGYNNGSARMIQNGYDYGCSVGENYLMPYRITFTDVKGNHTEWEVNEVFGWTKQLVEKYPELSNKIKPITILYHGTLSELYPDVEANNDWNSNILARFKADTEHFGMEQIEPMCKNKCYREGIVLRIDNDIHAEAFKLKTNAFLFRESKAIDSGDVDDEMAENYCN